jgi:hypothetical protein
MSSGSKREPLELTYGTQPPSRRRWLQAFILLAAMLAAVFAIRGARDPYARWQARRAYVKQAAAWYAAASAHVGKPGQLKYSEVAADVALPGAQKRRYSDGTSDVRFPDDSLDLRPMFYSSGVPVLANDWGVLFKHARTSDVGVKRLLVVCMSGWRNGKLSLQAADRRHHLRKQRRHDSCHPL